MRICELIAQPASSGGAAARPGAGRRFSRTRCGLAAAARAPIAVAPRRTALLRPPSPSTITTISATIQYRCAAGSIKSAATAERRGE
jgi:hypothetical protein